MLLTIDSTSSPASLQTRSVIAAAQPHPRRSSTSPNDPITGESATQRWDWLSHEPAKGRAPPTSANLKMTDFRAWPRERLLLVQHRFQPMAVRVADERRVVAGVVVLANARWSLIDTAFAERLRMEAIDRFPYPTDLAFRQSRT
jgi:hypothetical protein